MSIFYVSMLTTTNPLCFMLQISFMMLEHFIVIKKLRQRLKDFLSHLPFLETLVPIQHCVEAFQKTFDLSKAKSDAVASTTFSSTRLLPALGAPNTWVK